MPPEDNIEQLLEKLKSIRITPSVFNEEWDRGVAAGELGMPTASIDMAAGMLRLHQMVTEDQRRQSLDWILAPLRAKKRSYGLNQGELR